MAKKRVSIDSKVKDIVVRAVKTFVQAFLATLSVQIVSVDSFSAVKPVIVASVASGISAVWNVILLEVKK